MTFSNYSNKGPFTDNVVPPGISANFLNGIENFLDQIVSSATADSHITADGNGNETAVALTLTAGGTGLTVQHNAQVSGSLSANSLSVSGNASVNGTLNLSHGSLLGIAWGYIATLTNAGTTITHGLGGTPSFVGGQIICGTGQTGAVVTYITSVNSSSFVISSNSVSGFAAYWIALR